MSFAVSSYQSKEEFGGCCKAGVEPHHSFALRTGIFGQSAPPPALEVASVKPNTSGSGSILSNGSKGRAANSRGVAESLSYKG
jgi:hypothetical protein